MDDGSKKEDSLVETIEQQKAQIASCPFCGVQVASVDEFMGEEKYRVECEFDVTSMRRSSGLLVCWSVGLLVCWCAQIASCAI